MTGSWHCTFNWQDYREQWGLWWTAVHTLPLEGATAPSSTLVFHEGCSIFFFISFLKKPEIWISLCVCVWKDISWFLRVDSIFLNIKEAKENTFPGQIQPKDCQGVTSVEESFLSKGLGQPGSSCKDSGVCPESLYPSTLPPRIWSIGDEVIYG